MQTSNISDKIYTLQQLTETRFSVAALAGPGKNGDQAGQRSV